MTIGILNNVDLWLRSFGFDLDWFFFLGFYPGSHEVYATLEGHGFVCTLSWATIGGGSIDALDGKPFEFIKTKGFYRWRRKVVFC
jgi:hypothetical protein